MHPRSSAVATLWLLFFLFSSLWSAALAKEGASGPKVHSTKFDSPPFLVQYFDDSDVILAREETGRLWRSTDAGVEWSLIDDIDQSKDEDGPGPVASFWMHPYDNKRAYALSLSNHHWFTDDQGKSWRKFTLPDKKLLPSQYRYPLAFHAGNVKKVIFNGEHCKNLFQCDESSFFTDNDFKDVEELRSDSRGCIWAHASPQSHSDRMKEDKDDDRIICVIKSEDSESSFDNRIFMSDDFFMTKSEPPMYKGRTIKGIVNITVVKGYIITAAKAPGSTELLLFVTVDGEKWHEAEFPVGHKIKEKEYTILESTNYSIQVDALTTRPFNPMGVLFSSNSNGTYFTENLRHTNRNFELVVDFEKITGIQGIVMANIVKNWEQIEKDDFTRKQIQSRISFDDGRTWKPLIASSGKRAGEELHLHSASEIANVGKVFSSPAPGLIMGIGNTGDYLRPYEEGNLYVSDDAGLTWSLALARSQKYEFGDQGSVLLAVTDRVPTKTGSFSLDHGINWDEFKIDDDDISLTWLTTVPDSTSLKFILQANKRVGAGYEFYIYSIDFNGVYSEKCGDDDFERWTARLDEDGKADCLMGQKQYYRRRKKDASCYVGDKFNEAPPEFESCECRWEDFECDFNFRPEGQGKDKTCVPATKLSPPEGACAQGEKTFKGSAGFRKIPGNSCYDGDRLDEKEVERPCDQGGVGPAPDGNVKTEYTSFKAEGFGQKVYLERADRVKGDDETIIMSTLRGGGNTMSKLWMSKDHGKNWKEIFENEESIQYIIAHPYENDRAYFVAPNSKKVWYTINRGESFHEFEAPAPLATDFNLSPISFHPTEKEWLLWIGLADCGISDSGACHNVAYYSDDRGDHWKTIARYSEKCEFIQEDGRGGNDKLLYCVQHKDEKIDGITELHASDDFFGSFETVAENVLTFATMSEFIIVAQKDVESNLKVRASVDGKTFADAKFPHDFNVPIQTAYTLLDSSTHAVFLHVTVGNLQGFEYGRIMKSNSNGTSYVLSIDAVNRNRDGYVDFEKMQQVEGVALVNVVTNVDEEGTGKAKKLRSMITHNDGAEWAPLTAPAKKPDGSSWGCDTSNTEDCSLHLHSYTERDDPRSTFSSPTAIGLMMGVGNVGKNLGLINDPDETYTFISTDAGLTWNTVKKGRFKWEYGDQGSVIVIVERKETNIGYYSTNEGKDWKEFQFLDRPATVLDLSTVPSDNSKQFVIWVKNGNSEIGTVNVDTSGVRSNKICDVDEEHGHAGGDYWLWKPEHPAQKDGCLFGRKMQYLRKNVDADCWNDAKVEREHGEATNCQCTSHDFEW